MCFVVLSFINCFVGRKESNIVYVLFCVHIFRSEAAFRESDNFSRNHDKFSSDRNGTKSFWACARASKCHV